MMNIQYPYVTDTVYGSAVWSGPREEAIQAAVDELCADCVDGGWQYSDETGSWLVTADAMAVLGAALLDGRSQAEVYSIWCAEYPGEAADLTAEVTDDTMTVVDPSGGRWVPGPEAEAEIESSSDHAATALRICRERPMEGRWHQ